MGKDGPERDDSIDGCTTTGSFADHDIEDGTTLLQRTYYLSVYTLLYRWGMAALEGEP